MFVNQHFNRLLPCHRIHEEKIVVRGTGVLAIVHVFLLGGILDVFDDQLHLLTQVGFSLEDEQNCKVKVKILINQRQAPPFLNTVKALHPCCYFVYNYLQEHCHLRYL